MATLTWGIFGLPWEPIGSRTNTTAALAYWGDRATVFTTDYVFGISEATKEDAVALGISGGYIETLLPFPVDHISYPVLVDGPLDIYLPDVSPSFSEYPFTVQGYAYGFTAYRLPPDGPVTYNVLIVVSGLSDGSAIDPPPDPMNPPAATMQIGRNGDETGTYSAKPSDLSILPKYSSVKYIRAKFDTTRIAIIEDTLDGGFMIYEEVASEPSGFAYIYSGERKLVEIIDAANVPQYRARYVP